MKEIKVEVCTDSGWEVFTGPVPDGTIAECLALPRSSSRAEFWGAKLGQKIPEGNGLIWEILG